MYLSLSLLLVYFSITLCDVPPLPPGHMLPLGSHMPPLLVEVTDGFPADPLTFYFKYVQKQWPVIFKGLLSTTDAYRNWQSDSYLKSKFGDVEIGVEIGKKENRSELGDMMLFSEFLERYNTSDIYMVSDMPEAMKEEWPLPNFLLCGGYTEHLAFINVWFSSGGTKSVLHTDSLENFHCVVSGRKEFVMFEPHYSRDIGPEHQNLGYYHVDVERVDMIKYPNISKIQWYKATIEPGDCLYLPYHWIHHVSSYGRNMGVNVWWIPFQFDEEQCKDIPNVKGFAQINQFDLSPELQIKVFLIEAQRSDSTIHSTDMLDMIKKKNIDTSKLPDNVFDNVFEILLPGCNGVLHERDLRGDRIPVANYRLAMEYVSDILMGRDNIMTTSSENLEDIEEEGEGYTVREEL